MAAKSKDPVLEGLKRMMQYGEKGGPLADLPAGAEAAELEGLFLAELRSRRERLACWMQLIQEEVGRESSASSRPRWHQCRARRPLAGRRPASGGAA